MYSPKIPERFIPPLYRLGRARGQPMTRLVAEALERYLASQGVFPARDPTDNEFENQAEEDADRAA